MNRIDLTWLRSAVFTASVMLLLAAAIGAKNWPFVLLILVMVVGGVVLLYALFPGSVLLAIAFANFVALYICIFIFFMETNFSQASETIQRMSIALPIFAFLSGIWWRRKAIREIVASRRLGNDQDVAGGFLWLIPIAGIGALTFLIPDLDLSGEQTDAVLMATSGAFGVIVIWLCRDVCTFLLYTGILFDELFDRLSALITPAFVFFTFYSLIVIVFASIYRVIDLYSAANHFVIGGTPGDISFLESLYFSVITLSTVGYGDITPVSNLVRAIAGVQVISGVLLLLFGVSEIISYARERQTSSRGNENKGDGDTEPTDLPP